MCELSMIRGRLAKEQLPDFLSFENVQPIRAFHESMAEYQATPLIKLSNLAKRLGIKSIYVKDESYRFGLNAFKVLGSSYAISKILAEKADRTRPVVFVTATDGNHGKGVAWAAANAGCKAVVFMPKGSQECRAQAIRDVNQTHVEMTDFNYDDTVRYASEYAKKHGYFLVQDTGFAGNEEIPGFITQGYTTMVSEALAQLENMGSSKPTHVFLQAGVGSMAGGVLGYLANYYENNPPITTIVEPAEVACIYKSVLAGTGQPCAIGGNPQTIMAGLNCGEPNPYTWPILRDYATFFVKCPDWVTKQGMRMLANPIADDAKIVSGESGAVGLGLLMSLCLSEKYDSYRQQLNLNEQSEILLFSTEGNTDPETYKEIMEEEPC